MATSKRILRIELTPELKAEIRRLSKLSLAEYESLQETAYLLRSPANARRLLAAVDTLKRGKGLKRKIKLGA